MVNFRRMEEKDLDEVMLIEKSSFSIPWTRQDFEKSLKKESSIYMVAEEGGNILGYCGLWIVIDEGQINNVAVKQDCRGKHVGTGLMEAMIQEGNQAGVNAYTLEVRVGNAPAIALYKKVGFDGVGVRKNYYSSPREDALIMWKYNKAKEALL